MRQKSTLVALFFFAVGLIAAFVLHLAAASIFAAVRITDAPLLGDRVTTSVLIGLVLGLGAAAGCFAWAKSNSFVSEVIDELYKVNWPSSAETRVNTTVVIMTSVVAALILGVFDMTFGQLSHWLAKSSFHF